MKKQIRKSIASSEDDSTKERASRRNKNVDSDSRRVLASQIRKYLDAKNWKLKDLCAPAGLTYSYLSALQNGKVNIALDNIDALAKALDIPVAALFIDSSLPRHELLMELWADLKAFDAMKNE